MARAFRRKGEVLVGKLDEAERPSSRACWSRPGRCSLPTSLSTPVTRFADLVASLGVFGRDPGLGMRTPRRRPG
jgi:hypothetical protein